MRRGNNKGNRALEMIAHEESEMYNHQEGAVSQKIKNVAQHSAIRIRRKLCWVTEGTRRKLY